MTAKTLLRPGGLVHSPGCSHIALASAGADVHDLVLMSILVVDGVDVAAAYPVAAAALESAAPTVVVARVAGLAVAGALVELSAVAAVTP